MSKKEVTAFSFALLACLIWSGNFLTARGVHEWIPPFGLAFWRWSVAIAVITPFGLPHMRRQWSLICRHWKFLGVMGVLSVGAYNTLIYLAAHYTTTHHIALISSTAPIWTLLLAGIIGTERLSRYKVGGAVFAFTGSLVIIAQGNLQLLLQQEWNHGDILLLLAAWIWAIYCIMLHYKPKDLHPLAFLNVIFGVGLLCIAPFYAWETIQGHPAPFTVEAWISYGYTGIAASVLAWGAWNYAVHGMGAVKAGLVYYTIPMFSGILAFVLLKEPIALYHVIGFALIFTGIVISSLRKMGLAQ
ncbi:MAG: DMT family transporter [Rickettsiales bacterium]